MKFIKQAIKNPGDSCILWPFKSNMMGYGAIHFQGRSMTAHRVALILYSGEDKKGMEAAHQPGIGCSKLCINPLHIRFATPKQNSDDMLIDGTLLVGSQVSNSRLTEADVLEIRKLLSEGKSNPEIGRIFGVSPTTIWSISNFKTWGHVP